MMKAFSFLLILQFLVNCRCFFFELKLDPMDMIAAQGFPAEQYTVKTADGYLLNLYRIPHGRNGTKTNPTPVLMNHGLTACCGSFISLSGDRSIGFVLADHGFDVWLMNSRGSTYSNRHVNIPESNKRRFYDFSFHEVGYYDIPANIDFILNKTNQTQLHYFGHSQGGTTFLVMGSTRPEYNAKIRLATLLGATYKGRNTHPGIKFLAPFSGLFKFVLDIIGIYDNPLAGFQRALLQTLCKSGYFWIICTIFYDISGGYAHHEQLDQELFDSVYSTLPSNAAIKQMIHYLQCVQAERFQQYDFGTLINVAVYGTPIPPMYNMSKITAPISMMVAMQDQLLGLEDAESLRDSLPNVVNFKIVDDDGWNHGDFLFAKDVVKVMYKGMIKVMWLY